MFFLEMLITPTVPPKIREENLKLLFNAVVKASQYFIIYRHLVAKASIHYACL